MTATEDAALASALSNVPPPRRDHDPCQCADCFERRHAEQERRSWRELDAARRAAQDLRGETR